MSLRTRLIVAVLVLLMTMGATGVLLTATQRRFQIEQLDGQLQAAAFSLSHLPAFLDPNVPAAAPGQPLGPAGDAGTLADFWVGEVSATGTVIARVQPRVGASSPIIDGVEARGASMSKAGFTSVDTGDSSLFRMASATLGDTGRVIVIGLPLSTIDDATVQLVRDLSLGAIAMVAVMAVLGWWIWHLGLRPIGRMTEAAEAIRRGDLDRRVVDVPAHTEAGRLADAFNMMLDERIAVECRLRRFVGDASHELRTPLTTIKGYMGLYSRGALADPELLHDAMRRIQKESGRMTGLVDDLLLLARLDQVEALDLGRVDLALLLHDAASDAAAVDPDRHVVLDVPDPWLITADENRLRQVVGALVTNAMVHTPSSAGLCLRSAADEGPGALAGGGAGVVIEIADNGPGMAPEVAAHAFERFYRGDASRTRHRGGTGLGLAIVESIVTAHGGTVQLESSVAGGTRVRIMLAT